MAYEACVEPQKEWQKIPEADDVPAARDMFARRILAVIEEPDANGYAQRLEFLEDGFTVATGGREFDIRGVTTLGKSFDKSDVSPYLDEEGVRAIAHDGTHVKLFGAYGAITLNRRKIVEIMGHLRSANKEGLPLTVGGVAFELKAEVFFCDIERTGECSIEFVEKQQPQAIDPGQLALQYEKDTMTSQ